MRWQFVPVCTLLIKWGDTLCQYLHCLSSELTWCANIYIHYSVRRHILQHCNRRTVLFGCNWTLLRAFTITLLNLSHLPSSAYSLTYLYSFSFTATHNISWIPSWKSLCWATDCQLRPHTSTQGTLETYVNRTAWAKTCTVRQVHRRLFQCTSDIPLVITAHSYLPSASQLTVYIVLVPVMCSCRAWQRVLIGTSSSRAATSLSSSSVSATV